MTTCDGSPCRPLSGTLVQSTTHSCAAAGEGKWFVRAALVEHAFEVSRLLLPRVGEAMKMSGSVVNIPRPPRRVKRVSKNNGDTRGGDAICLPRCAMRRTLTQMPMTDRAQFWIAAAEAVFDRFFESKFNAMLGEARQLPSWSGGE